MKNIKRLHNSVGLVCCLLLMLGSCQPPAAPTYVIGFSQCTVGDNWRRTLQLDMERELSFHANLQLRSADAHNNSELQIRQIQQFIDQHVDVLIVSPNEAEPITPVLEKAYQQGIPVILVDRRTTSNQYSAFIGADNREVGFMAGQYIVNLLKGRGSLLEITGATGSSPARDRHVGFRQALAQSPGVRVVQQLPGDWEQELVKKRLPALLKQHPEVAVIFAHNDRMAVGAYEVCKQLGLDKTVKVIGVDGLAGPNGGMQWVEDGLLQATILYPTGGEEAIRTAVKILNKERFDKENRLETTVIDPANVHILRTQTDKMVYQQADIQRQQAKITEQIKLYRSQTIALYCLIILLIAVVALSAFLYKSLRENRTINRQMVQQNEEILSQRNRIQLLADQARDSAEAKLRFFTNLSHELRTPLTLMLMPVDELLKPTAKLDPAHRADLSLVRQNARRLLQIVNQLIDFRRTEDGKMPLQISPGDLVAFSKQVMSEFEALARRRSITFRFLATEPVILGNFDPNLFDKVLYNLLSNAFKFTPDQGRISLSIKTNLTAQVSQIQVEDTGEGLSDEERIHVFEWFYQAQNNSKKTGSGIGLSLAQELVRLHGGTISLTSQPGVGSCFTVSLPLEIPPLLPTILSLPVPLTAPLPAKQAEWMEETSPLPPRATTDPLATILIIEDQEDLRTFICQKLGDQYRMMEAGTGALGHKAALETVPDLILCDLMLPDLFGTDLVRQLRQDWRTAHIPVIVLTALHAAEHQLNAAQAGADLYLTKPFQLDLLREQIRTLLRNRQHWHDHTRHDLSVATTSQSAQKSDRRFLQELAAVVEAHYRRNDLSVEEVAERLNLSRVQLYRKVKNQLGCGVTDYIQGVRLTKARYLLLHEDWPVSEVAYQVGFTAPTYFSTAFKARFQVSPSEFRQVGGVMN